VEVGAVAQMMMTGASFNPFHLCSPNPWEHGKRFNPKEHSYKGLIAMLDPKHVDSACDASNRPLYLDLLENFTLLSDMTLPKALIYSTAAVKPRPDPLIKLWGDFLKRDIIHAW